MKKNVLKYIVIIINFLLINFSSHSHEINRNDIENIVREFLIKNPDFIKSTLDKYQVSLENKKKQNTIRLLKNIDNPGIFQKNANITIYEFFDYNCGYCKLVVKTIMEVLSEDKNINFVFVEFPILSRQSYIVAKAALASKKQDLYNRFHLSLILSK